MLTVKQVLLFKNIKLKFYKIKTEAGSCQTQSIQQMQLFDNNQPDMDDPMDNIHGPVRLPLLKKGNLSIITCIYLKLPYYYRCFR